VHARIITEFIMNNNVQLSVQPSRAYITAVFLKRHTAAAINPFPTDPVSRDQFYSSTATAPCSLLKNYNIITIIDIAVL
jgi:hypothetical protein